MTPATPLTYPIERSISPSSSTNTTPIATITVPDICTIRLLKLTAVKNALDCTVKKMTITTMPRITGRLPTSPAFSRST